MPDGMIGFDYQTTALAWASPCNTGAPQYRVLCCGGEKLLACGAWPTGCSTLWMFMRLVSFPRYRVLYAKRGHWGKSQDGVPVSSEGEEVPSHQQIMSSTNVSLNLLSESLPNYPWCDPPDRACWAPPP